MVRTMQLLCTTKQPGFGGLRGRGQQSTVENRGAGRLGRGRAGPLQTHRLVQHHPLGIRAGINKNDLGGGAVLEKIGTVRTLLDQRRPARPSRFKSFFSALSRALPALGSRDFTNHPIS